MSEKLERDDDLWELVDAYERCVDLSREVAKMKSIVKNELLKKLGDTSEKYRGLKRVRKVDQKTTEFSSADLARKYGEEFVEENKIVRIYTTIDVKEMARPGPLGSQC